MPSRAIPTAKLVTERERERERERVERKAWLRF